MNIRMLSGTPDQGEPEKEPSPKKDLIARAHSSKVIATHNWIEGRISQKEHEAIHKRANAVLSAPHKYIGKK